jgi:uncharacterized protein (DUF1697 family)
MPTHIALLRGINVGGQSKVAMADLRKVVSSLGHTQVETYIQSGNVLFTSADTDTAALAGAMEQAIAAALHVKPRVVVLSREQLARVVDDPVPAHPGRLRAQRACGAALPRPQRPDRGGHRAQLGDRHQAARPIGLQTTEEAVT